MNIRKMANIVILVFLLAGLVILYLTNISTPLYSGRLVIDLTNNTWKNIEGATLRFGQSDTIITIPIISPQERVILIAPTNIFDKPVKTTVSIQYQGQSYYLLDEYYALTGDIYNADTQQVAKAVFNTENINVFDTIGFMNFTTFINIKPYSRVIDMNL